MTTTLFTVLNGLEVENDGRPCPTPPPKLRTLIATLLALRGAAATPESLIDDLWGEDPPPSAHATLQTYIYQLRRYISRHGLRGSGSTVLRTGTNGYELDIDDEQVDEFRFRRLVRSGTALFRREEFAKAAQRLRQALAMGRGVALVGVVQGPIARSYAVELDEQFTLATHLCMRAELSCGRHFELVNELRGLVVAHPLDEDFHHLLIQALTRCGRRAEALQAYQDLRDLLQRELGLDPSAEAQSLQTALLHG